MALCARNRHCRRRFSDLEDDLRPKQQGLKPWTDPVNSLFLKRDKNRWFSSVVFYISALILIVYVCPLCHISPVVSPQKEQKEVNPVFFLFLIQNYIDTSNFVSPFCPLKATERVGDTVPDRLQVWPWGCWIQRARCHGDPLQRIRVQVRLWRPNRNMLGVNVFFFLSWLRRTSCNTTAVPGSVILTLEKTSLTLSRCSYRFSALLPWWPPVFPACLDRTRQRWEIRLVVVHDWITQLFAIKWKWPWPPLSPPYPAASATGSECHFTSLSAHCQKSFLVIFGHPKYDQQP